MDAKTLVVILMAGSLLAPITGLILDSSGKRSWAVFLGILLMPFFWLSASLIDSGEPYTTGLLPVAIIGGVYVFFGLLLWLGKKQAERDNQPKKPVLQEPLPDRWWLNWRLAEAYREAMVGKTIKCADGRQGKIVRVLIRSPYNQSKPVIEFTVQREEGELFNLRWSDTGCHIR